MSAFSRRQQFSQETSAKAIEVVNEEGAVETIQTVCVGRAPSSFLICMLCSRLDSSV